MADLLASEKLSFPRIRKDELKLALEELAALLSADQSFVVRARRVDTRHANLPAYDLNAEAEISIADGLVAQMLGKPRRFPPISASYQCEVFAYMVVRLLPKLSEPETTSLLGKIKAGLNDSRHFDAIFFELLVGFTYHCHGCDVSFRDLVASNDGYKNFDFDLTKNAYRFSAEIKTVDYRTGQPYRLAALQHELRKLLRYLTEDVRWVDFRAEVVLTGERNAKPEILTASMDTCIAELRGGKSDATTPTISVKVVNGDPEAFRRVMRAYHSNQINARSTPYHAFMDGGSSRTNGFIGFKSRLEWRFTKAIADIIRGAEDQLQSQHQQALWVRAMGHTANKADAQTAIAELLQLDSLIRDATRELHARLRAKKVGELVCVHLVGTTEYHESADFVQVGMSKALVPPTSAGNMIQHLARWSNPELTSGLRVRKM